MIKQEIYTPFKRLLKHQTNPCKPISTPPGSLNGIRNWDRFLISFRLIKEKRSPARFMPDDEGMDWTSLPDA